MRRGEQPPRSRAAEGHGLHLREQPWGLPQGASATSHPERGDLLTTEGAPAAAGAQVGTLRFTGDRGN